MKKLLLSALIVLCLNSYGYGQQSTDLSTIQAPMIWGGNHNSFGQYADYKILPRYGNNLQKSTTDDEDLPSRMIGTSLYFYDGNAFNYLVDSVELYWQGDRNQLDLDSGQIMLAGAIFPFNPLTQPGFMIGFQTNSDSLVEHYLDGSEFISFFKKSVFDANGYLELETVYQTEDLNPFSQILYDYDDQGNCLKSITMAPQGTNQWDSIMRWEYSYNIQNQITGFDVSVWNSGWDTYSRFISTYENGLWTSEKRESWSNNQWVNTDMHEFAYDDNNQMIGYTQKVWMTDEWVNSQNNTYSYDSSGKMTESKWQGWNGSAWTDSTRAQFEYNGDMLTTAYQDIWDSNADAVGKFMKYSYFNNEFNQFNKIFSTSWNGTTYEPSAYADATFNMYYEELNSTNIQEKLAKTEIHVYPNPAFDELKVELDNSNINKLRIVDMTGKVVYETKGSFAATQTIIPVRQLTNGIYILEIQSGEKTGSKKLVVNH